MKEQGLRGESFEQNAAMHMYILRGGLTANYGRIRLITLLWADLHSAMAENVSLLSSPANGQSKTVALEG